MATCSQCEVNPAAYQVDSSVLCQPCLADTQRGHNVSRLQGSRAPRIDLKAMQAFRRRVAGGEFTGTWLPALAAAVVSSPTQTGRRFRPNLIDRTVNFVRKIWSPFRGG